MSGPRSYGGLDAFRLPAALLVVAIHTAPLADLAPAADFFLTRVLGRVAVPFFFLVTGHFVLGPLLAGKGSPWPYCRKVLGLYAAATLLYLPLGLYAGHYAHLTPAKALRLLVFDGTFYHLWYFPACVLGLLLLVGLGKVLSPNGRMAAAILLYLLGLLGDSWYGLAVQVPLLDRFYDALFQAASYTRNGLFFVPLFLLLGARLGQRPGRHPRWFYAAGLLTAFLAMTAEAVLLRRFGLPRHDSMYLLLPLVMVFLYRLLLTWDRPSAPAARTLSTAVYVIHPAMIVAVRGAAEVLGLTALLVGNSLAHYLAVCLLSLSIAWIWTKVRAWREVTHLA